MTAKAKLTAHARKFIQERDYSSVVPVFFSLVLIVGLFFLWGGANNLNDILITQIKMLFTLSDLKSGLVQSAFYMYFLLSISAALLMSALATRLGCCSAKCFAAVAHCCFTRRFSCVSAPVNSVRSLSSSAACYFRGFSQLADLFFSGSVLCSQLRSLAAFKLQVAPGFKSRATDLVFHLGAQRFYGIDWRLNLGLNCRCSLGQAEGSEFLLNDNVFGSIKEKQGYGISKFSAWR